MLFMHTGNNKYVPLTGLLTLLQWTIYTVIQPATSWNFWNILEIFHEIFHEIFQGKNFTKFYITISDARPRRSLFWLSWTLYLLTANDQQASRRGLDCRIVSGTDLRSADDSLGRSNIIIQLLTLRPWSLTSQPKTVPLLGYPMVIHPRFTIPSSSYAADKLTDKQTNRRTRTTYPHWVTIKCL